MDYFFRVIGKVVYTLTWHTGRLTPKRGKESTAQYVILVFKLH